VNQSVDSELQWIFKKPSGTAENRRTKFILTAFSRHDNRKSAEVIEFQFLKQREITKIHKECLVANFFEAIATQKNANFKVSSQKEIINALSFYATYLRFILCNIADIDSKI